jgi:hypothetical protein
MMATRNQAVMNMVTSRRTPALRSQAISVGLLAVRARAAVKRTLNGEPLTDRDSLELTNVRDVLRRASEALRYGENSHSTPGARQLTSVGLALSSIAPSPNGASREEMAIYLGGLASDVDLILGGSTPVNRESLSIFLTSLLRAADRDTAQNGEVLVGRS